MTAAAQAVLTLSIESPDSLHEWYSSYTSLSASQAAALSQLDLCS